MKIAIVTSLNRKLYEYYAHRFYKTYNWPFDCYIYHEGWIPETDPERNISKEFKSSEIFQASDMMVESLTQLLDRERNKRKAS